MPLREEGGRLIVSGALTIDSVPELVAAGAEIVRAGATVVDLSDAGEVDSAALSLVLEWRRTAGDRELRVTGAPAAFDKLAKLYGVADLLPAI